MEGILGVLDVDSSIHLKQVDLDYAASFNKNKISGINDTYIVMLIMSEYCRRGQHINGQDNFMSALIRVEETQKKIYNGISRKVCDVRVKASYANHYELYKAFKTSIGDQRIYFRSGEHSIYFIVYN